MDKELQNKLSWLILIVATITFVAGLALYSNSQPNTEKLTAVTPSTPSKQETIATSSKPDNSELLKRRNTIYGTNNS